MNKIIQQLVDLKYIVHENAYHRLQPEEPQKMLEYKSGENDYETWIKAFCDRKYHSDFSREMQRSVREVLKQFGC